MQLANVDISMAAVNGRENRLKEVLIPVKDKYDFIILDWVSSVFLLPTNAMVTSDKYIIPCIAHYLSLEGLVSFLDTFERVKAALNAKCEWLGILITIADYRANITKEIVRLIRKQYKDLVFKTKI